MELKIKHRVCENGLVVSSDNPRIEFVVSKAPELSKGYSSSLIAFDFHGSKNTAREVLDKFDNYIRENLHRIK